MPVTRVPIVINPDGGGCDVNDELNHSNIFSEQCYQSDLDCATISAATTTTTTTTVTINSCSRDINQSGLFYSRKRTNYSSLTFLPINMRVAIIGVIGVLVVQFAGTLGISNKEIRKFLRSVMLLLLVLVFYNKNVRRFVTTTE
ncbi:hypothetical protein M0804_011469 [Polistes exclamans]|nr:hypothetical protein M0804_011469 [Polistes exclamans]